MSKGRRSKPKPYVPGPRKQMTIAWKQRVIARLLENKTAGVEPANLAQLAASLEADKRGIYETFNLEREPPQMASAYVDAICELLDLPQPLQETPADGELEKDLDVIRGLSPDDRRAIMLIAERMKR